MSINSEMKSYQKRREAKGVKFNKDGEMITSPSSDMIKDFNKSFNTTHSTVNYGAGSTSLVPTNAKRISMKKAKMAKKR